MANREDLDIDDDFSELYKEYTGPPRTNTTDPTKTNKTSHAASDEEEETRDPNAVPTDFTSREAKVWEAKSKATERNWKKRKEEEMICKICGESGHFTQGCPSTLGANRKSQDFFERVPARDPQVKALFTEKVISRIEKDIGCKIKMEEKFMIVSGKDRLILAKGVDAVHKIKHEGDKKVGSSSNIARSRSPEGRSPITSRMGRSDSQRSNPSPRNSSHYNQRFGRQEKIIEERVREDLQKLPRGSPQAYGNDGARGRSTHSKSPARPPYTGGAHSSYDGHSHSRAVHRNKGWDADKRGPDLQSSSKGDYSTFPQTLEDLHLEYKKDAMEMTKIRDKEEDEENNRHRETVREMRENYMKRFAMLRAMHAKQWEEFLQLDAQQREQRVRQHMPTSGFDGYKQDSYSEYDNAVGNPYAANMQMDLRVRYSDVDNYPSSRSHDNYGDFQRQRHEEYGKAYNRF
ncbi:uncharacterized protein LOC112507376 isoform X2 [Cynara cardunculus var. scolymus]|uniref:CCHC-type domain-containing protein n=1 Tax=Cynara cardunculus var. scolymus TaxID=59895 RepID=A0A103YP22_CYNCS|nr:uncharacterized protein LOC112507376 isoform X2 [Cynara cardunculus var. scolymus]KVI12550.1 hypothetical protein Ccrd_009038 [Cynara cardunculus var. scolymus]